MSLVRLFLIESNKETTEMFSIIKNCLSNNENVEYNKY